MNRYGIEERTKMENCEGCLTVQCSHSTYSGYKTREGIVECPCSICLIKMVCRMECDPYIEFIGGANIHSMKEADMTISDCLDNVEKLLAKKVYKNGKL
jgi:hypothetical protein